jgi:hypothetical protein
MRLDRLLPALLVAAASEARTVSAELVCEMSSDAVPPMTGRNAAKGGR